MKLLVHVIEARCLPAMDLNGSSDPYVTLRLGSYKLKSRVVQKNLNPYWDEKFSFRVEDLSKNLNVEVYDEDRYCNDDFIGKIKIPLSKLMDADNLSLGIQWYPLQPTKNKSKLKDCGEIRLGLSLSQNDTSDNEEHDVYHSCSDKSCELTSSSDKSSELSGELYLLSSNEQVESSYRVKDEVPKSLQKEKLDMPKLIDRAFQYFKGKNTETNPEISKKASNVSLIEDIQEATLDTEVSEDTTHNFDDLLKIMASKDLESEFPINLPGGVLIDQLYVTSPADLNSLLFAPNSEFQQTILGIQGTTDFQAGTWKLENDGQNIKRTLTYTKAATRLIKAVKASEDQTYLKCDGKSFAVLSSVSVPDVPFGNCFKTEILTCILVGPELPTKEPSSRLVISWRINFEQSTMMKGMIENGARQGLKESYGQFVDILSKSIKPVDIKDVGSSKDQILASLQMEQESGWKLAFRFFGNFTVLFYIVIGLYVTVHVFLAKPSKIQGLEFVGIDLPDSIEEIVVSGFLVLQGQHVFNMIARYLQARRKRASDHGVQARGDGWLLTVALLEGSNLASIDSSGYCDPFVVFTCNGKTKTSSIKFQTLDPQWNEIFEFDAMDGPPSMMNVEVYDFDGPFDEARSLGHAEVNFVKSNLSELADAWIPLKGKLSQACQSKLHLRIFLNNTRENEKEVVIEYITKMEREVGKKINVRSPQTNSEFQKIFSLPPEEFLINDFTCHLKRKMIIHGRLFLSPRIIGFYTNLFGHKTKFFFLWEDIEDIQVGPPSLSSMGSPTLMIILRRGRGLDARHGAKSLDKDGRLIFQFQSFVSPNVANRTIMALWKARSLSPEQKLQIVEESNERTLNSEDTGSFLGIEDVNMSEVFTTVIPLPISSLMELFQGGSIEIGVMEKVGCVDYSTTPWEPVKNDICQRQIKYSFDKNLSRYGGTVTSTQTKFPLPKNKKGWVIEEVMTLQGIPLGDSFDPQLKYVVEDLSPKSKACNVQVYIGICWHKRTKHQKKITKNVTSSSTDRLKEIFRQLEKEFR